MQSGTEVMSAATLLSAVKDLLREEKSAVVERERSAFDSLAGPGDKPVVLFGAGNLGRKTLAGLRKIGIQPAAFTDSNPRLWNTKVEDLLVLPPEKAASFYGVTAVFVITIWTGEGYDRMGQREQKLRSLGCKHVSSFLPLFWKFPDTFLPHYAADLPHKVHEQVEQVLSACALWSDEASRLEYLAQLRWRLFADFDNLPNPVKHPTYFPPDLFQLAANERFVDCGAFDGDTIQVFLQQPGASSAQIHAFEADPENFAKLKRTVSTYAQGDSIKITNAAVGAFNGKVSFCSSGNESSFVSQRGSGIQVDSVTLDDALGSVDPTYIKMDIEGAELDALTGAKRLIQRNSPVLSVCSYHQQDHVWKVPLLIHSINPHYRFFLRPHLLEVWDLVCYAIPEGRPAHKLQ